jgi:hypothetical protein
VGDGKWDFESYSREVTRRSWEEGERIGGDGCFVRPFFFFSLMVKGLMGECRYFDLQNQVTVDKSKLDRIEEYEKRLSALTKTLTIWFVTLSFFSDGFG